MWIFVLDKHEIVSRFLLENKRKESYKSMALAIYIEDLLNKQKISNGIPWCYSQRNNCQGEFQKQEN